MAHAVLGVLSPLLITVLTSACISNFAGTPKGSTSNGVTGAVPATGNGSGGGVITLSTVVKDTANPTSQLDLLGDGSGAFGQFCFASAAAGGGGAANGNAGPSNCKCHFSFTNADGSANVFDVDTLYHEDNLIRCDYTKVPSGSIPFVNVSILLSNSSSFSNTVTFRFTNAGSAFDPTNPSSFVQVERYQCKDVVTVPHIFGGVYDPIQSEDPRLSYPLNFYTTNMGGALALYSGGFNNANPPVGWNCPAIPNDPSAGMDLTLYSVNSDTLGSKLIFPPNNSAVDRSTFFVAKTAGGVFTIPVNAIEAPTIVTDPLGQVGPPPIGFAASPSSTSPNTETCPDTTVQIPTGFHWMKLWLFRADLDPRKFIKSAAIQAIQSVSCIPDDFVDASNNSIGVFPDCGLTRSAKPSAGDATSLSDLSGGRLLSDRILGSGMCVNMNGRKSTDFAPFDSICGNSPATANNPTNATPNAAGCTTGFDTSNNLAQRTPTVGSVPHTAGGVDYTNFALGTDVWDARNFSGKACVNNDPTTLAAQVCSIKVPVDPAPSTGDIDIVNGQVNTRSDFLYVVSPPTINTGDMDLVAPNTLPYLPYRFFSPNDCHSSDPDVAVPGDCLSSRVIHYKVKTHDIGLPGDPTGNDPQRGGRFPLCVLQPN
ncbi:MAG: hypothetical protein ACXVBW_08600 [Bdellovibrionota bacterium]